MKQRKWIFVAVILLGVVVVIFFTADAWFTIRRTQTTPVPPDTRAQVTLYYYNPDLDMDSTGNVQCSREGLVPVTRIVPSAADDPTLIEETLQLLLRGELTAAERAAGITTEFPLPGVALTDVALVDGTATLTFSDPEFRTTGGSCRVGILWSQIATTAEQFSAVNDVRFMPEELFQP